jgi:hypothetical protein
MRSDAEMGFIGSSDTETHRMCGTCGELKPNAEFYKDGKDHDGNAKYRRDCKACYKKSRINEDKLRTRKKNRNKEV